MSAEDFKRIREFVTTHPVAIRSAKPLKTGVEVGIFFTKDRYECRFVKGKDGADVYEGRAVNPDFTLYIGENVLDDMLSLNSTDIGEYGIAFFKHMMNRDPKENVLPRFNIGFLKMMTHGYVQVIMLGGMGLFKWLAKNGVNIKSLRNAFEKLKSETDKFISGKEQ